MQRTEPPPRDDPNPHHDPELERQAQLLARKLANACDRIGRKRGRRVGFTLTLYDFGEGGALAYMSNGNREDCLAMLKELIAQLEGRVHDAPEDTAPPDRRNR